MSTTESSTTRPRLRWYQFRLRSLLVFTLVVSVCLGWLTYERRKIAERREAFWNPDTLFPYRLPSQPTWRLWLFGDDWPSYAKAMWSACLIRDTELEGIKGMSHLETLRLNQSLITDHGLFHLKDLPRLRELELVRTRISDAGLAHLSALPLWRLDLRETQITDAGLRHLKNQKQLLGLRLKGTRVTDEGINELRAALPNLTVHR